MKKTLMTIAIAAALTGTAFATQPSGGGSAVMGSVSGAATGANAASISTGNGGDGAYMFSAAGASNGATADYNTSRRDTGVETHAATFGQSYSLSFGDTYGSGMGSTFGVAGQAGLAAAKACDGASGCGSSESAEASSLAGVASLSATGVVGNGYSYQGTVVGAENSASADADTGLWGGVVNLGAGRYAIGGGVEAETSAKTEGYTYSSSYGETTGNAWGATGGLAVQAGQAGASAKIGLAKATSDASVGTLSGTGVWKNGDVRSYADASASNESSAKSGIGTIFEERRGPDRYIGVGAITSADSVSSATTHTWTSDNTNTDGKDGAIAVAGASSGGSAGAGGLLVTGGGSICPPNPPPSFDVFGNPGNAKPVGGAGEDPNGRGESWWETGIRGRNH